MCLASEDTCVILAGDHLQTAERVYSREAQSLGFDRSLTERLDRLYSSQCRSLVAPPPVIRLHVNYRNHAEITEFLSSTLYDNQLISASDDQQTAAAAVPPLNFYAVYGREIQDSDSTSVYNMAEVEELVTRVNELCCCWPAQWGTRDCKEILVTAAYSDQVSTLPQHSQRITDRPTQWRQRISNIGGL